jgi:hypothetical protein
MQWNVDRRKLRIWVGLGFAVGLCAVLGWAIPQIWGHGTSCCFEKTCRNFGFDQDKHRLTAQCQTHDEDVWQWTALDLDKVLVLSDSTGWRVGDGYGMGQLQLQSCLARGML